MNDLINVILFYGFFLGVTLAAGNLALKKENKRSEFYTLSLFLMGLCMLQIALYSTRMVSGYEYLSTALLPVSYAAATLQYARYNMLVTDDPESQKRNLKACYPAVAVLVIVLIPAFHGGIDYDRDMLRFNPVLTGNFSSLPLYYKTLMLLYPAMHFYHVFLLCIPLTKTFFIWNSKISDQKLTSSKASYLSAASIGFSSFLIAIGCLFSITIVKIGLFLGSNSMLLTFLFATREPEFRMNLHEEVKKYGYMKSKIKSLDVKNIISRMEAAMKEERAYAVEGITIKSMAAELDITVHQLSEILNHHMGKNFNAYVNSYRIDEAKRLLVERPDMTIIDISGEVGFSSSSMFSTLFSKSEGISPRDFRKKELKI